MGHYGNEGSLQNITCHAGIIQGMVELFIKQCFTAIESLHNVLWAYQLQKRRRLKSNG
jgi:hypothetical protein